MFCKLPIGQMGSDQREAIRLPVFLFEPFVLHKFKKLTSTFTVISTTVLYLCLCGSARCLSCFGSSRRRCCVLFCFVWRHFALAGSTASYAVC